ncbi:MAG: hypothetical protein EOP10_16625 [Proteobacteria bacterium]|nr:MAG: hypothetical protein EOP10_16625 [Pseudomonadota bacterium]
MSVLFGRSGVFYLSALLALTGCGKDGSHETLDTTPPAPLGETAFTLRDLDAPAATTRLSSNGMKDFFSGLDFSFKAADFKFANLGKIAWCANVGVGESIRSSSTRLENGILSFTVSGDLTECYKQSGLAAGATNIRAHSKYDAKYEFQCPGVDLSQFANVRLDVLDFSAQRDCPGGYRYRTSVRNLGASRFEFRGQKFDSEFDRLGTYAAVDLGFCETTFADGVFKSDGCVYTSKNVEKGRFPRIDYTRLVDKDLTWVTADGTAWYSSGSREVQFNNWTGVITYSGADVAPVYELKSGVDVVSGALPGF